MLFSFVALSALKVGMLEGLLGCNSSRGLILEHLFEEIETLVVNRLFSDVISKIDRSILRPLHLLEVRVLRDAGPNLFSGQAH